MKLKDLELTVGDIIHKKGWREDTDFVVCLPDAEGSDFGDRVTSGLTIVDGKVVRKIVTIPLDLSGEWVRMGNVEKDNIKVRFK